MAVFGGGCCQSPQPLVFFPTCHMIRTSFVYSPLTLHHPLSLNSLRDVMTLIPDKENLVISFGRDDLVDLMLKPFLTCV